MPNRGQTQDQDGRGRNPGTFSPDDDETAQNEDNQRQAQEEESRGNQRDLPADEGADVESDDDVGSDDNEVTGVTQ
jgi:hypothetical protein